MRVLHLTSWKTPCGIADFAAHTVAHLASRGVVSEVFPLDVARQRSMTAADFAEMTARLSETASRFDLVHVQHEYGLFTSCQDGHDESVANFSMALAGLRAARRPVVVTFHTPPDLPHVTLASRLARDGALDASLPLRVYRRIRSIAETSRQRFLWRRHVARQFGRRPNRFVAVATNPWVRLALIQSGFDPEGVVHVPHGIIRRDPGPLRLGLPEAKARLGLPADSVLLTMFGFVSAYKGHLHAVAALRKLPARFHLAIVGGVHPQFGDDTLENVLAAWEREDPRRLIVTGYAPRETIDLYHAATDICLAPTLPGFRSASGSICWSLTSGRPTIASRIPVFSQIESEGDCLLLCTPGAAHELAWLVQRLAADSALQRRLAENALRYAEQFSWDRMTDRLLEVYGRATGLDPARVGAQPADPPRLRAA